MLPIVSKGFIGRKPLLVEVLHGKIGIDRQSALRLSRKLYARGKAGHKGLIKNAVVIGSLGVVVISTLNRAKLAGKRNNSKFVLVGHKRPSLNIAFRRRRDWRLYMKC